MSLLKTTDRTNIFLDGRDVDATSIESNGPPGGTYVRISTALELPRSGIHLISARFADGTEIEADVRAEYEWNDWSQVWETRFYVIGTRRLAPARPPASAVV
jgi:hypothetical protein